MSHRPWTAIIATDGQYTAINVTAHIERENAKREIEEGNPGREVVALIPGTHASYVHTFSTHSRPHVINPKNARYLDPFDTSYIADQGSGD